jgi:hypothetical protein
MARPENREEVLAAYYKVPVSVIAELALVPPEKRKELCKRHGINPQIFRTMVDYNRYGEASLIHEQMKRLGEPVAKLSVLDFGCLVADYGLYFARLGAKVAIYDRIQSATTFARFRFATEKKRVRVFPFPTDYAKLFKGRRLVIFGEVLEHMESPLEALQACAAQAVPYIFTSCYPFGSDKYFAMSGHLQSAQAQQPACIELLAANYVHWHLEKKAVLWQRRKGK